MGATTQSIEVNAPLRAVYNQWTQFEEFPRFMEGVEEVRQQGDKHLFWRAKVGGKVKEWQAEITNQVPDERIAWRSVDGSPNSGTVIFAELGPDRTRVTATIEYEPEGLLEKTGDALGIPSGRIERDLEQFRNFIDERGRETGGWRGQVREGESSYTSSVAAAGTKEGIGSDVAGQPYQAEREISEGAVGMQPKQRPGETVAEVPTSKEEVKVGKRTVGAGDVKLRKRVSTEQVNVPVELKREDAVIERVPAHEIKESDTKPFEEERIEVPLTREESIVEKETHVIGGVRVRKTEGTEQETIHESVRREDVNIDESGKTTGKTRKSTDPDIGEGKL
jgi:uncharacterized protein (TIGR02271 family)